MRRDANAGDLPERWLSDARGHLGMAGRPLPLDAKLEMLCFHAQQAAEFAVKAVLVHCGVEYPPSHDIDELLGLVPRPIELPPPVRVAGTLGQYAVEKRYPDNYTAPVSEQDYEIARRTAKAVVTWAENIVREEDS